MDKTITLISSNKQADVSARLDAVDMIEKKLAQASGVSCTLHELAIARKNNDQGALSVLSDLIEEVRDLVRQVC